MRTRRFAILVLTGAVAFLSAAWALAQESGRPPEEGEFFPPLPERLEEMIDIALSQNPDIVQARAEVQAAAAELRRTQLRVVQEITEVHERSRQLRQRAATLRLLYEKGRASDQGQEWAQVEADLAAKQAETRYLLGVGPGLPTEEVFGREGPRLPMMPKGRPPISEEFDGILSYQIDLTGGPWTLELFFERIAAATGKAVVPDIGIDIQELVPFGNDTQLTVRQLLRALTDRREELCFIFRDYGILATLREKASHIDAPCLPEDVPLFVAEMPPFEPPPAAREQEMSRRGVEH